MADSQKRIMPSVLTSSIKNDRDIYFQSYKRQKIENIAAKSEGKN